MDFLQNVALAPLTTLGVGGAARYFAVATSAEEVLEGIAFSREQDVPMFVLGGGSNLVVSDAGFQGLVLQIAVVGVDEFESGERRIFSAGAGEDWDAFVARTVKQNCAGMECLSGIPGTVGGTPVQNVGAYGQEVSDTIVQVDAINLNTGESRSLSGKECAFTYRSSRFNTIERGQWAILRVYYSLLPGGTAQPEYADLRRYFERHSGRATLSEVRAAVLEIRKSKAMLLVEGDEDCRSAGSFFKNPILTQEQFLHIQSAAAPETKFPHYPAGEGRVKISAAWLVEQAGFPRGTTRGNVGISRKHALAIVNHGTATAADVVRLSSEIQTAVRRKFRVELQPEPVHLGF
jgi:UDP-N-acetylmuramate dehydrogenase